MKQIPALIRVFAYLSLLTVGGGMAAFPEMKILAVDVHHLAPAPPFSSASPASLAIVTPSGLDGRPRRR